ncbi:DUF6514 family protein [Intestinimonas butyriciproducens]|uniref:Uncharacterized protein n=1 Tax=Candidatus Intestinimonas merdavium TaxID=2838622 RepID=A0A9D1Z4F4_9FIRM|nr:DUF6514 family protein [Intestinimonas butyriciproducens]MBM6976931.1 hypothetical protein [Intestinimonas butyriciproducens]HIY73222.1 hypothetical protein [Candidatus Intestinimonas merdavium]
MKETRLHFEVCAEEGEVPVMFGVVCRDGTRAPRLSSDYTEVERLVRALNRNRLSPVHFWDVIEDFRHSWGEIQ